MRYILAVILLLLLLVAVTGCVKEAEVCNYDGICVDDETDECADCKDVLGRDIEVISPENSVNSP